ncbi:uncharacterized protein [Rutidosis leptorrhynchoides]|uniref:uncharacterized protein n=1 Tax=Rutidosis leptorrhynchoides TaxID=125765 RepID=UPI003A9977FF
MQRTLERYVKRKVTSGVEGCSNANTSNNFSRPMSTPSIPKKIDIDDLPWDLGNRKGISEYDPNQRDEIRILYLQRGPCQPHGHLFPVTKVGDQCWKQGGSDAFVIDGFRSWSKKRDLMFMRGNIEKQEYRIRLQCSVDAVRYVMHNALPFRGHDESEGSIYKGIFLETLKLIGSQNENARKAMSKAPKNCKLTSSDIQKDIVDCFAKEILKSIFEEIGNDVFGLLVEESSDVSRKEKMAVVLRYVDSCGVVKERFVGVVHVKDTSALTLKDAIDSLFAEHKMSMKQVRGQGYNVASNMRGEFNVAKHHDGVGDFFDKLALVVIIVSASCKRKDMIRDAQNDRLRREIANGEVETGRGKIKNFLL